MVSRGKHCKQDKFKKKIPEYEAANSSGVKRLNKLLPNTVFVRIICSRFVSAVVSAVPFLFLRVCFCGGILVSAGVSAVCFVFLFLRCHFCFCGVSAEAFLGRVVAQNLFLRCLCGEICFCGKLLTT